jgi:peroxiredoxin
VRFASTCRSALSGWASTLLAALLLAIGAAAPACSADDSAPWRPREGRELIGTPAPEWRDLEWLQGGPLTLEDLRGRVVLVRFWLVGCPYCRRSAPALVHLQEEYGERGLVVVGIHHPKSEAAKDPDVVRRAAEGYGFDFPLALDDEWSTIRAYGVGSVFERFTSVSFLIGPDGVIRWVHDGGAYAPGEGEEGRAYESLVEAIERWLPEG